MRLIKLAFISLIVFSLFITGISLFFPSHVRLSKAIDIKAPMDSVMSQVADPAKWTNWYPGADSAGLFVEDGRVKGILNRDGKGLVITAKTDSSVSTANAGPGSRKTISGWNFYVGSTPATVTVQWYMDIHLRWYPWEKFSSLLLEKRYGPVMEEGLDKLKIILEKQVER